MSELDREDRVAEANRVVEAGKVAGENEVVGVVEKGVDDGVSVTCDNSIMPIVCAPVNFPVNVRNVYLFAKQKIVSVYGGLFINGGFGAMCSSHIERVFFFPDKIEILWFSFVDRKAYHIKTKIKVDDFKTICKTGYNALYILLLPAGKVVLYLGLPSKVVVLESFCADSVSLSIDLFIQNTMFKSYDDYVNSYLKSYDSGGKNSDSAGKDNAGDDSANNLEGNGLNGSNNGNNSVNRDDVVSNNESSVDSNKRWIFNYLHKGVDYALIESYFKRYCYDIEININCRDVDVVNSSSRVSDVDVVNSRSRVSDVDVVNSNSRVSDQHVVNSSCVRNQHVVNSSSGGCDGNLVSSASNSIGKNGNIGEVGSGFSAKVQFANYCYEKLAGNDNNSCLAYSCKGMVKSVFLNWSSSDIDYYADIYFDEYEIVEVYSACFGNGESSMGTTLKIDLSDKSKSVVTTFIDQSGKVFIFNKMRFRVASLVNGGIEVLYENFSEPEYCYRVD